MYNHSTFGAILLFCLFFIVNASPVRAQSCVTGGGVSAPVSYSGLNGLVIDGLHINTTSGNCVTVSNCTNVVITNCIFGPSLNGWGVYLSGCNHVRIYNCRFMDNQGGIYALHCTGNIQVDSNQFSNVVVGSSHAGHFIQYDNCSGTGNQINANIGENIFGPNSNPSDLINLYQCTGTATDPIYVLGNEFRGGGPNKSGGGIILGDAGGYYEVAQQNILVNPGQYGMAFPAGSNMTILDNEIYSKSFWFNNVGIYVDHLDGSSCGPNLTVNYNQVNYFDSAGNQNYFYNAGNCGTVTTVGNNWPANIDSSILPARLLCPVLMAYYRFDNSWADSAMNSAPATSGNAAFAGQGMNRMCANFNGTSSYVDLAQSPWLQPTLQKLTVSCWIKPGALNGIQGIAQSQNANGYTGGWRMILEDSTFNAHMVTDSATVDIYVGGLLPGVWTQLVMTYDGDSLRGYVNGTQRASVWLRGHVQYNATSPMQLGYCSGTGYYLGYMDELKFYDGARNDNEILADYQTAYPLVTNPPPALRAYYSFQNNWGDNSGDNFTATPVSGATFVCAGDNSAAAYFNGGGDYAYLQQNAANSPWLDPQSSTLTVSCWIYPLTLTGIQGISHSMNGDGNTSGWRMLLNNGTFDARVVTNEGGVDVYCSGIQANTWNFVAMTYDGTAVNGYVNGALISSTPSGGYIPYNSNLPMRLGICNGSDYFMNGYMDEFKFYDGPRTATEIQQDYNATYPLIFADPNCPTSSPRTLAYSNRAGFDSTTVNEYLVSPNPASTEITIRPQGVSGATGDILQIQLYNAVGQVVRSVAGDPNGQVINVADLRTGIYYVRIIARNKVTTTKVLISPHL
jgi:parallel beta-helix repeat protein